MLNPLIKPYNLRGGPRAEYPKLNTTSCGLHSFTYHLTLKKLHLYTILNHFYRNGLGPNATVALASYVRYTMSKYFISYILYFVELLGYTQDSTFYVMTNSCLVKLMSYINLRNGDVMCLNCLMCVFNMFSFHQPLVYNHPSSIILVV